MQTIAKGLSDPRARGLITVTEVKVADDLKTAEVFISVLPDKHEELTLHALRHASKHLRRQAAELMALQHLPELHFKLDTRLKQQAAVYDALAKVRREQEARGAAKPSAPASKDPDPEGAT